jgi:hypothetical protein
MAEGKPLSNTAARRAERRASVPRVALDMDEIGASLALSTPGVYGLVEAGLLRTFVVGRRRLASIEAIAECVRTLEAQAAPLPSQTNRARPAD